MKTYRLHHLKFYGNLIFNHLNFDEIVYDDINISLKHHCARNMDKSFFRLIVKSGSHSINFHVEMFMMFYIIHIHYTIIS